MFLWHAEVLVSSPRALKLGAVGHTCKPSTHGLETRTSEVQGHAWLHSELKGNFDSVKPNQRGRKEGGGRKETTISSMTLREIILYNCLSIELTATASQQQP